MREEVTKRATAGLELALDNYTNCARVALFTLVGIHFVLPFAPHRHVGGTTLRKRPGHGVLQDLPPASLPASIGGLQRRDGKASRSISEIEALSTRSKK